MHQEFRTSLLVSQPSSADRQLSVYPVQQVPCLLITRRYPGDRQPLAVYGLVWRKSGFGAHFHGFLFTVANHSTYEEFNRIFKRPHQSHTTRTRNSTTSTLQCLPSLKISRWRVFRTPRARARPLSRTPWKSPRSPAMSLLARMLYVHNLATLSSSQIANELTIGRRTYEASHPY